MNQISIPALVPPATTGNLTNLIADRALMEPQRILVSRPMGNGWQPVTAKDYEEEIKSAICDFCTNLREGCLSCKSLI